MAFGGSGGFSFGNNNTNNNNQSSGFGGFGNSTNTNTGFGANTGTTGFGSSTTGSNPFGGAASTFGTNTGGFGANSNTGSSLFGANKPASSPFGGGSSSSTGLFGGTTNTASTTGGFGGFGGNTNTNTGGFGSSTTAGSGGFGGFGAAAANKPAFGASAATTTPLFGQNGTGTTGGFGSSTTGAFGSSASGTALNQPVPPSDGTASTPFTPTVEKEPNGTTNSFQSITFQQPYQKYSFEELRIADYNAGRRFGNGSGQAGGFGSSTFGGFGSSNTGGTFGNTNTNSNPFGTTAATSSGGFGSTTATSGFGGGSSLFGNATNKPGGLFGTATSAPGTTGGLFGSTNTNTTGGFGTGTTGGFGSNTNTGTGGLFGGNTAKPGGLFGNTGASTTSTGSGFNFGNNNNNSTQTTGNTGGLFGSNNNATSSGGLFGNTQTQPAASGGLFGSNNNQSKPTGLFGATGGFGSSTTQSAPSGGLFGTTNSNNNSGGGLFGTNNNNNAGGGLFGTNTSTSGGLFGNNNAASNNTGGLFGSNNNANNQTKPGGLFGTSNNSGGLFSNMAPAANTGSSLFGNNASNTSGGTLFGNSSTSKPGNSIFGAQSTSQPAGGLFGSSAGGGNPFGTTQNNQQNQQQQDQFKHSSLLDPNPYGQSSIWTGLPAPTPENAKPVFTPLTATQKLKESMMKPPPSLRLNQSRYMTPPRRNGFGFSYSNYGTPNSAASTPGGASLSGSMYGSRGWSGGSFGRSFTKSASVQNLRAQYTADGDDMWKPGAFASAHRNSGGSIKRLTIDRSIRNDLFSRPTQPALPAPERSNASSMNGASTSGHRQSEPQPDASHKLKKRVSFDSSTGNGQLNSHTGALVRTETDESDNSDMSTQESRPQNNNSHASRGKELAAVPEDRESDHVTPRPAPQPQPKKDPKPGDYWMRPSRAEIAKLPRERLQNFKDFQVGRYGCGQVTFNGTVDLTSLRLDDLYDKIVEIRVRSITVYPEASMKPPVGKGLNVPSTIAIENSWPRSRNQPSSATSGPIFDKHIERLNKIPGTEFVDYEVSTGVWTFRVPHYTRYGLDYDDDEEDMSELSPPPDTIEKSMAEDSVMEVDADDSDHSSADDDDTFAFKQKTIPGGFGRQSNVDYEPYPADPASVVDDAHDGSEQSAYSEDEMSEDEPSMAGSFPAPVLTFDSPMKPSLKAPGTPGKPLLDLEGDWADQLQRTISPRKQNRDNLRDVQSKVLLDMAYSPIKPKPKSGSSGSKTSFRNSVDVMSSIFGKHEAGRKSGAASKQAQDGADFEFPYAKRAKTFDSDLHEMPKDDRAWLQSFRTHFIGTGELISRKRSSDDADQTLIEEDGYVVVRSRLATEQPPLDIASLLSSSEVVVNSNVPCIEHQNLPFSYLVEHLDPAERSNTSAISNIYTLAHIFFDTYEDKYTHNLQIMTPQRREQVSRLITRDRLSDFLTSTIHKKHAQRISTVDNDNPTAAAVLKLTYHDIKGACDSLEKAGNFRLMILVSQLENAGPEWQAEVKAQIDTWREQGLLSEMTEDVRALYEICAGNVTISQGRSAAVTPVEDRAKTFALSEEYNLDWLQCFALGYWYGGEELRFVDPTEVNGNVSVEDAVILFAGRCDRGEESAKPLDDPLWAVLRLYASRKESKGIQAPILPQALSSLCTNWDVGLAFKFHHALIAHVGNVAVDIAKADELAALYAFQLSSRGDLLGAIAALLHLSQASKRAEMIQNLLERFADRIPDPTSTTTAADDTTAPNNLWTQLTSSLKIPESWIYTTLALHARAVRLDPHAELNFHILAQSWDVAHDCLLHRVAPACIIDADYTTLADSIDLFGIDAEHKVGTWIVGGSVYSDFVRLVQSPATNNNKDPRLVDGLRVRLADMSRQLHRRGDQEKEVQLGKLSVEELEERVAVREMAKVVAEHTHSANDLLDLPITSDQKLSGTLALAGEYYRAVMAGGK